MNQTISSVSISELVISGKRYYTSNDEIMKAVFRASPIGTFMSCDVYLIQKEIKKLPWIKQVSVRKQWPNKVKVYVLEYIPIAYWNCSHMMITEDAVVFSIPKQVGYRSFPMLFGPTGSEKDVLVNYYIFIEILKSGSLKLKSVGIDNRYSWEIILENDVRLLLGRKCYIGRLSRFVKFYPVFFEKNKDKNFRSISYIDLRYKSGFSMKVVSE